MDHGDFTSMVITMWAIWHARRKLILEEVHQSPLATYQFVQIYLSEMKTSKGEKKAKLAGARRPVAVAQWCPPPMGYCKINVDGAVAKTANRGAVGAVCRAQNGMYLGIFLQI
jgi:hypothetical protein